MKNVNYRYLIIGLIAGIFAYSTFGVIDYIMMPVNYKLAWIMRFYIVVPVSLFCLGFIFFKRLRRLNSFFTNIVLISAQISIFVMIILAEPSEPAFYGYFAGSLLMVLVYEFIFQFDIKPAILFFAISAAALLLITVLDQIMLNQASADVNPFWLIGNFYFFTLSGTASLLGHYRLQKNRDKAERANQMKVSFLTNISHEIRTPLNGILGYANLLTLPDLSSTEYENYKRVINSSSNQLLNIVDNIILMAEIETCQTENYISEISLSELLSDVAAHFSVIAEHKGLNFVSEIKLEHGNDKMWTDEQKLRIILNNLLDNAVKFTPKGSVTFKAEYQDAALSIEIIDTGIGISKEYSDRIFEDFYQQDTGYSRKYGGNGIGLAICKSYLNLLNGTITVQSEPDKGSSFVMVITGFSAENNR